jgi:hypothetical protein
LRSPRAAAALFVLLGAVSVVRGESAQPGDNAVLLWNDAILKGIIDTSPGPTAAARALAVAHTAMFDAWSAYDAVAMPTRPHRGWRRPPADGTDSNKAKAVSYAAYRVLVDLFPGETDAGHALMARLGYDPTDVSTEASTPAGVGNVAAHSVLAMRHGDGSNQIGDLHPGAYSDYTGYTPVNPPTAILDPNRWQPQLVVNGQGQIVPETYTTPQWGLVTPFAMASGSEHRPGPPILYPDPQYKAQADELIAISAGLTDFQKVSAEFFADGPGTEFPPGHWALFAGFVSRRDSHTLDQDVVLFFALGNALLDASICAWDAKRAYDSVRPITAIHFLYAGQMILAWGGPFQGTRLIPGESWKPYQLGTVVTPPFPEFFSGHSVFSAAGAEVLKSFTGSDAFGYAVLIPKGSSRAEPGLVPAADLTLSWATFTDCADAAGMSRRYGGIHFQLGDLTGRSLGRVVGAQAWAKARTFVDGTATVPLEVPRGPRPRTGVVSR